MLTTERTGQAYFSQTPRAVRQAGARAKAAVLLASAQTAEGWRRAFLAKGCFRRSASRINGVPLDICVPSLCCAV
jgi:hypothetical protein